MSGLYAGFSDTRRNREETLGCNIISSIDALRAELVKTRERGYAVADEEAESGTVALAVVFPEQDDADGPTLGTVSVAGPAIRLKGEKRRSWLAARLHAAAAELSTIWPVWKRQRPTSARVLAERPRVGAITGATE